MTCTEPAFFCARAPKRWRSPRAAGPKRASDLPAGAAALLLRCGADSRVGSEDLATLKKWDVLGRPRSVLFVEGPCGTEFANSEGSEMVGGVAAESHLKA